MKLTRWDKAKEAIDIAWGRLDSVESRLAARIMALVIKPYCDKYKLTFTVGNGTFSFTRQSGAVVENRDNGVVLVKSGAVWGRFVNGGFAQETVMVHKVLHDTWNQRPLYIILSDHKKGVE